MSIRIVMGACALCLVGTFATALANSEAEQLCRQYAKEDGISQEEMASYMKSCISDVSPYSEDKTDNNIEQNQEKDS